MSSVINQHGQGQFEVVVLISLGVSSGHAPNSKLKQFPVVYKYYVKTLPKQAKVATHLQ